MKNHRDHQPEITFFKSKKIDEGALGTVYSTQLAVSNRHEMFPMLVKHQWVYKEVLKEYFVASEPKLSARYDVFPHGIYPFAIETTATKKGWIAKFIRGIPFSRANTKDLNFNQLIQLIFELVVRTNLFHHHTIRGNAIIHGDINRENIHFYYDPDRNESPEIEYFDYGLSIELTKSDDPIYARKNPAVREGMRLNKEYFAPEAWKKNMFGIKTDIFMLAICIQEVLLDRFPVTTPDVSHFIEGFLAIAKSPQYQKRPDSDEFLKFFTLANLFYKIPETDILQKNRVAAKLAIMYARKNAEKLSDDEDITWQQYYLHDVGDFTDYDNDINITVRCIAENGCDVSWDNIFNNADFVKSVARLDKLNMTNHLIIQQLYDNSDICNQFARGSIKILSPLFYDTVLNMRKLAFSQIEEALRQANSINDVNEIILELETLAANHEIDYLNVRQRCRFSINQHQWKGNDVSGTWIKAMNMAELRKIELFNPRIEFEEFEAAYNQNYQASFFKNPWSKMRAILDDGYLFHSMDEVFQHARENPDSRTVGVLKQLALNKINVTEMQDISRVEMTLNVI